MNPNFRNFETEMLAQKQEIEHPQVMVVRKKTAIRQ